MMDLEKLNPQQRLNVERNVIIESKKIVTNLKEEFIKLREYYNKEYADLIEENRLMQKDMDDFSKDMAEFRNMKYSLDNASGNSSHRHDEMKIIRHLLEYEKKLIVFANHVMKMNQEIAVSIRSLDSHAENFIGLANNLDSAHSLGEFSKRLELIEERKNRIISIDKGVVDAKLKFEYKKKRLERIMEKIIHRKKHLLNKLRKDLKKDDGENKAVEKSVEHAL